MRNQYLNFLTYTLLLCIGYFNAAIAQTDICYAVAEDNAAPNTLFVFENNAWSQVGITGTTQLEAIAIDPSTGVIYAADGGILGTLDANTAVFTAIGAVGFGDGANGNVAFDDIDGLTWDDNLGILWASNREGATGANDLLLQIDPATGAAIPGNFSGGDDYVIVEEAFDGTLGDDVFDVDDIAWNPITTQLFAIQNEDGPGVISIINKFDGSLEQLVYDSSDQDLEGLGFDSNGDLFSTSGNNGSTGTQNSFIQIDYQNQISTLLTQIDPTGVAVDFESFDCYRLIPEDPIAGSLTASSPVCMSNGSASLVANHIVNPLIPTDFAITYVLTSGNGLVIEDLATVPFFTVNTSGDYTIHTLVYDPTTLDVNTIVIGTTTGFDVNALLTQGGGTLNGALDVIGASISVLAGNDPICLCNDDNIVQQSFPCYAVAEDNGAPNTLWSYDQNSGWTEIGVTGASFIEAIATNPTNNILYAIDGGTFGTLNTTTGAFIPAGAIGSGSGANGIITFDDIDGLTYDAANDILWASQRVGGTGVGTNDLLLQIDPNTGTVIAGVFGGDDYVVIEEVFDGTFGADVYDVDDIALNPFTGQLFAIQNQDGPGLISIINTTNGDVDQIIYDTPDEDLEGLGFDVFGNLFATSGNNGNTGAQNSFIQVDYINGISNVIGTIDPTGQSVDFESFDCFAGFHDLQLTKSLAPNQAATINTGDNVTFEIVVTNVGQYVANNVTVEDLISSEFTFVSGDFSLDGNGNGVAVLDCALEPGSSESLFITLNANVSCDANGGNNAITLNNSAEVTESTSFYAIPGAGFVTLSDINDSNNIDNAQIEVIPGNLLVTSTITNESCAGNDGTISIIADGQAPYTYDWSNAATTQNLTNVVAGTYSVLVTDANGCTDQLNNLQVAQDANLAINSTNITNTFCGASNGAVEIEIIGGLSPFTYSWSNGSASQNLSNLNAGNYTVTITDSNGCTGTETYTVTNTDITLNTSTTITDASCDNALDGAINLSISNGTAPYNYIWSTGATTSNLTNLASGNYGLIVTDANGCSESVNGLIVEESTTIEISALNITNTNCGSTNGAIDIEFSGGVSPYLFDWSNGSATEDLSNLAAGSYTITIADANGCFSNQTFEVINDDVSLIVTNTILDASCDDVADGAINLTVSGGTAPYNYTWSTGATTQNLTNVPAGNYGVVITDANGCSESVNGLVINSGSLVINTNSINNAACQGGNNGSINIDASGGTAPYNYIWSNGSMMQNLSNINAGNYTVVVTDAAGCSNTESFEVLNGNVNILANATVTNPSCFNSSDGSMTVNPSGGLAPYTYLWNDGSTSATLSNISGGSYSVMITDQNGCSDNSGSIQLTNPSAINLVGSVTDATTLLAGSITTFVTGGTAPYTYLWNNGSTTSNLNNLQGGTYTVIVTDANGCTTTDSYIVEESCINCVFDLSLTKDLTPGQSMDYGGNASAGDDVSYTITVVNQGDFDAQNVEIADYVPTGLSLSFNDNNGWTPGGFGFINNSIPLILAGQSASIDVIFTISPTFTFGSIVNVAEIMSNERTDGITAIDVDSSPDSNNTNDFIAEDDIDNAIIFVTPAVPPVAGNLTTPSPVCIENGFAAILAIPDGNTFVPGGAALLYLLVDATTGVIADANTTSDFLVTSFGQYTVHTFVYDISDFDPATITFGTTLANSIANAINSGSISADLELPGAAVNVVSCVSDLSLIKDLAPNQSAVVSVNETVEFEITVTNQGVFPMQNIQVTDYVPNGLILATNNPGWSLNNGNYTYILPGTLQAGEETMISIFFQINPSFEGQILDNFAEIIYAENLDGTSYDDIDSQADNILGNDPIQEDDFDDASILVIGAVCNVTITDATVVGAGCGNFGSISLDIAGGTGSYLYSWSNGTSVPIATNLSPGTYSVTVADSDGCSTTASYTVISSGSNLDVNGIVFDAGCNAFGGVNTTTSGGVAPYSYTWSNGANTANISGVTAGNYSVNVSDASGCSGSASFVVSNTGSSNCNFDLALQQSFINNNSVVYNIGDDVTYVITVTNQGDFVANNVSIIDYIPSGLILNDNDWILSGGNALYTIPQSIPAGGSVAVAITLTVGTYANCGSIKNAAEIVQAYTISGSLGNDVDSTPDNIEFNDGVPLDDEVNNASNDEDDHDIAVIFVDCPVITTNIDLSLNKSVNPTLVAVGGTATYTITVSNSNLGNATGVTVLDQLPSGVTYLSDNSAGAYNLNSGIWTIGSLAAGQSTSLNITCIINNHTTALNTAQVMSHTEADIDSTPGNSVGSEDDQDTAVPIPPATQNVDLALNKNVTPISIDAIGDIVTWTIIVSNQSNITATGVTVLDDLPNSLTYISDNSNGAFNSNTGLWTVGTLNGGANAVLQITTLVNDFNDLTNYAQIATTNELDTDSTPGNNSSTEDDDDTATLIVDYACSNIINTCTQPITPIEICVTFCNAPNAVITDVQTLFDCSIDYLPNGCIEYTPLPGLTITDELTIIGSDSYGNTDVATAFVDIGCDGNFSNEHEGIEIDEELDQLIEVDNTTNPFKVTYSQIFGDVITVDFENNTDEMVDYQLLSIDGKLINYGTAEATTGINRFHIQDVNVVTGLYIIVLNNGKEMISHKMLIE